MTAVSWCAKSSVFSHDTHVILKRSRARRMRVSCGGFEGFTGMTAVSYLNLEGERKGGEIAAEYAERAASL